jgi:integrase
MAYAERRGKAWRVRYQLPDGLWDSASGFETKEQALSWGRDQETDIRRNEWRDPRAGDMSLANWIAEWWPAQDLEPRTEDRYGYLVRTHILPWFGKRPLNSFNSPGEIADWEKQITATSKKLTGGRYAPRTAQDARDLLATILGDAVDGKRISVNVAARRRGRGRKARRRAARRATSEKAWATPLEVLLIAERAATLTGQDDDFVLIVTTGWTGMRWGEVVGLERPQFQLSHIRLDLQLNELNGLFRQTPPKDDSRRNGEEGYFGPIDLPPFLSDLLSRQVQARPDGRCRCPDSRCSGTGQYLFLGPDHGHYRRSTYNRRIWHPAVDGVYPAAHGRPARPVLVDMAPGWPGRPLRPAWPYAAGETWAPPRGRGWTRFDLTRIDARQAACPSCAAARGAPCTSRSGRETADHRPRIAAAAAAAASPSAERALACWLPIKPGLQPHGLRHGHKTWMIEDQIAEVLQHDRLGHEMDGIKSTYSHVSESMRDKLKKALQTRWETALDERARLSPRSAVVLLDELLAARRETNNRRSSPKNLPLTGEARSL